MMKKDEEKKLRENINPEAYHVESGRNAIALV
jgi:hypothetical protein